MPDNPGGMDSGLASILQSIMGSSGATAAPQTQQQGPLTLSDIEQLLAGTSMSLWGRSNESTQRFTGPMPQWVPDQVRGLVRKGIVDPYLGLDKSPAEWRVYMGRDRNGYDKTTTETRVIHGVDGGSPQVVHVKGTKHVKGGDRAITVQQAMNEPYLWTSAQVAGAIKKFQAAGLTDVKDFDSMTKAWGSLVQRAGAMYSLSSGKRKVTPWDVLDMYKTENAVAGTALGRPLGPGDPGFNGNVTHVSRSVADISQGDAWTALQTTLSNMLGRDPSSQEIRDFTYRMNSLAARNPSITKTIEHYKDGQAVSSSSHTRGGFDSNDLAQAAYYKAQSNPGYAEYQAATTYFNAAMDALGAIGG